MLVAAPVKCATALKSDGSTRPGPVQFQPDGWPGGQPDGRLSGVCRRAGSDAGSVSEGHEKSEGAAHRAGVALAIGLAVAFFPALAGVAITAILWGVVHLTLGFALAAMWMRVPPTDQPASKTS